MNMYENYYKEKNAQVGRVFRKGSFWDRLFKGATAVATVFVPFVGGAMALADRLTPERPPRVPDIPGGYNVAGMGKMNKVKKPKVF